MGLKGLKMGIGAIKAITEATTSGKIDIIINQTLGTMGKMAGYGINGGKILVKRKHHVIVRSRSFSIKTIAKTAAGFSVDAGDYKKKYILADETGSIKYTTEIPPSMLADLADSHTYNIFNTKNKIVGEIKEHILSFSVPLFEKDKKRCTAFLGKKELFGAERYYSFKKLCFSIIGSDYSLEHDDDKKIEIKKGKNTIAEVHQIIPEFKDDYIDQFIVEYDDINEELPVVLLTLAYDILR